jgi:excisionase family DNA binding protein
LFPDSAPGFLAMRLVLSAGTAQIMAASNAVQIEWLTANEAAQYLKVKPRTLLVWAKQGKVRGYVLSGTERRVWRFLRTDLDAQLLGQVNSNNSQSWKR